MSKADISTKEDVILLVNTFYDRVKQDDVIGFIFHHIIGSNWSHHLPVMYSFWETVLFGVASYTGNAVGKHLHVDRKIPLETAHYERWLSLWHQTVDDLFTGPYADSAKYKAGSIIQVISKKVEMARTGRLM